MSIENDVRIIGRLGADPELKQTRGDPVCNIRVATSQRWKDKEGNKQERTEWHSCVFWGKSAELVDKHFSKGDGIIVRGELRTRMWEDNGVKHYRTEIHADNFGGWMFPPGKAGSGGGGGGSSSGGASDGGHADSGGYGGGMDDDIPF